MGKILRQKCCTIRITEICVCFYFFLVYIDLVVQIWEDIVIIVLRQGKINVVPISRARDRAAIGLGGLQPPLFFKDRSKTLRILNITLTDL